jgi:chitinase
LKYLLDASSIGIKHFLEKIMRKRNIHGAMLGFAFGILWLVACTLSGLSPKIEQTFPSPILTSTSIQTLIPATSTMGSKMSSQVLTSTPTPTPEFTPSPVDTFVSIPTPSHSLHLIAYFYGQNENNLVSAIPGDLLTDIIYAFVDISADGKCASMDPGVDKKNYSALQQLNQFHPSLRILFSIGGYSHSARFSDVAASENGRIQFVQSCIQYLRLNGLDGIDIDWEFPVSGGMDGNKHRLEDSQNFTVLLAEFRKQLDLQGKMDGKSYLLSIAAPAGPSEFRYFELSQICPMVDWITVMAYDFYTGESKITHFNAPLFAVSSDPGSMTYNGDSAVKAYLAKGIPSDEIVLGVPFYGRAWKGVTENRNGLFQQNIGPFDDPQVPAGTWGEGGEIEYRAIKQYYLGSWPRFWQNEAQVPWLYNPQEQIMLTFDDPESLAAKADYVRTKQLGGISIWQISGDDEEHSLLRALAKHLWS